MYFSDTRVQYVPQKSSDMLLADSTIKFLFFFWKKNLMDTRYYLYLLQIFNFFYYNLIIVI